MAYPLMSQPPDDPRQFDEDEKVPRELQGSRQGLEATQSVPRRGPPVHFLDHALRYAQAGWPVFPARSRGKQPLTFHGVKDSTTTADIIRGWWQRWPDANIALAVPEGFLVVDVDSPEALHRLRAEDVELPATARARTARGLHLWYMTGEVAVRNRVGIFPGIDVRAAGGYVIVPPSRHPSGSVYRWEGEFNRSTIADCPEWLLHRLTTPTPQVGRRAEEWHRKIAEKVPEGRRNQALAELSGLLFRQLPAEVAAELAYCWAAVKMDPPLSDHEIQRTLDSIASLELRRRGAG